MAPERFTLPIDFDDWSAEQQVAFFLEERALNQAGRQSKVSPSDRAEIKCGTIYCTKCGEAHAGQLDEFNFCRDCGTAL